MQWFISILSNCTFSKEIILKLHDDHCNWKNSLRSAIDQLVFGCEKNLVVDVKDKGLLLYLITIKIRLVCIKIYRQTAINDYICSGFAHWI